MIETNKYVRVKLRNCFPGWFQTGQDSNRGVVQNQTGPQTEAERKSLLKADDA